MKKQLIIEHILEVINRLPEYKAKQISDFADFVFERHKKHEVPDVIAILATASKSFEFLNYDEEIYSINDLRNQG